MANYIGILTLVLHKAEDLYNTQTFGKQDPYLKVHCGTKTIKGKCHPDSGRNPIWEQTISFHLEGKEKEVKFEAFDRETVSDDYICETIVQIPELVSHPKNFWYSMNRKGKDAGSVLISCRFQGTKPGEDKPVDTWADAAAPAAAAPAAAAPAMGMPMGMGMPGMQMPMGMGMAMPQVPMGMGMPGMQMPQVPMGMAMPGYPAAPAAAPAAGGMYGQPAGMYGQPAEAKYKFQHTMKGQQNGQMADEMWYKGSDKSDWICTLPGGSKMTHRNKATGASATVDFIEYTSWDGNVWVSKIQNHQWFHTQKGSANPGIAHPTLNYIGHDGNQWVATLIKQ